MKQFATKVVTSILSSVILSVIMFFVVFSVITGEFPPDLGKVKKSLVSIQQMQQMVQKIQAGAVPKSASTVVSVEEDSDVSRLEAINAQRAKIGAGLLGEGASLSEEPAVDMKQDVRELQRQLVNLQNRVSILEEELNSKNTR